MSKLSFGTVLIANRGEIAVRIIKTLRKLGLRSAIVYHDVDTRTPAVSIADMAIPISGRTPVAAYLDSAQIIAAARKANAGALHPGYGFLSENADFARAVMNAGIAFIGPAPESIELMGDKIRARNFVRRNGFPVARSAIEDDHPATFVSRASSIGAPILVKPSAGGGGKGMRIVRDLDGLEDTIAEARSEAQRHFGDGRLYMERSFSHQGDGCGLLTISGETEPVRFAIDGDTIHMHFRGKMRILRYRDLLRSFASANERSDHLVAGAPMPGVTVTTRVSPGQPLSAGTALMMIESMKLETVIRSPNDGVVDRIHFKQGDSFERDAVLITLSEAGR
ncbi:biotin carboxylase N-terminal domain-containing protein [Bradyrhizobium sp. CB3481]|uniref:biotin carboxylase N-terminal domain-containing protein n=1 Tax=Bradyrhizobium sp. CB3481 TaxID=3039158 RepID=UPI0024B10BDD|nr:biotin carboxylase N-terminal domain-containing protein [Bradyrhizobium sp. CB3481]WFU14477.1 biotin carboxylase N-terminal domain-containing protein [Bradyrhizobium sp. CB3481]